ncbi:hypothetical protein [Streptomyces mirabilis]
MLPSQGAAWLNGEAFEYFRYLRDEPATRLAVTFVGGEGCRTQNVDALPAAPAADRLRDFLGHHLGVGGHALGVEGRLGQEPLSVVVTVRTRPESVTQSFADPFDEHAAFVEGAVTST